METRSPALAGLCSVLLPGLGQLYNGERAKGWSMLCITAGLLFTIAISRSGLTRVLLAGVYLLVLVPSALDALRTAQGRGAAFSGDQPWYVMTLLLTVGPFALPLLWHSPRFSRGAKIGWTVGVILLALLFFLTLAVLGPQLEQILSSFQSLQ